MATIQVFKHGTEIQLGKGDGTVDAKAETATIKSWDDKPGLKVGKSYKLEASGKVYLNANCTSNQLPVTFDNVV